MDFKRPSSGASQLSILPLGGIEDVTRNMYLYMFGNEILIVDCGLGFADETMLGVQLMLPDVTPLLKEIETNGKKIVGMVLTHGHEDHIGAVPFILPQLPPIPVFATPLTAAFTNEKLREFGSKQKVQEVQFNGGSMRLGSFEVSFIRVTHSVPDSANILIKTPVGTVYHASDFKFDLTPADGKKTAFQEIAKAGKEGVLCLVSDCLGAERSGFSESEHGLEHRFRDTIEDTSGKVLVTTYSSNVARINQVIEAARMTGRNVCFVGRSVVKVVSIAKRLGYLRIPDGMEVPLDRVRRMKDHQMVYFVAGSQGQENSAMTRIANDEHREISLTPQDTVILSSDIIPGNEILVHSMIDAIAKKGARVLYKDIDQHFHVSGHGSQGDLMMMMSLVNPRYIIPISGTYRQMVAYRSIARRFGFKDQQVVFTTNGREVVLLPDKAVLGKKVPVRAVYVDEISGEEVESFVLRDRERLAREGVVIVLLELDSENGSLAREPELIIKGFSPKEVPDVSEELVREIQGTMQRHAKQASNRIHVRRFVEQSVSNFLDRKMHRRPLVLPVVIEV